LQELIDSLERYRHLLGSLTNPSRELLHPFRVAARVRIPLGMRGDLDPVHATTNLAIQFGLIGQNKSALALPKRQESKPFHFVHLSSRGRDPLLVAEIELPIENTDDLHLQPILRGGGAPMTASLYRTPFQGEPDE
jgi:hypothetical protein